MTIIAILAIMTITGKIEVFFNVTRMEGKKLSTKFSFFLGENIYGRSIFIRRGNMPVEEAESRD